MMGDRAKSAIEAANEALGMLDAIDGLLEANHRERLAVRIERCVTNNAPGPSSWTKVDLGQSLHPDMPESARAQIVLTDSFKRGEGFYEVFTGTPHGTENEGCSRVRRDGDVCWACDDEERTSIGLEAYSGDAKGSWHDNFVQFPDLYGTYQQAHAMGLLQSTNTAKEVHDG
jgi:hypothetical protein